MEASYGYKIGDYETYEWGKICNDTGKCCLANDIKLYWEGKLIHPWHKNFTNILQEGKISEVRDKIVSERKRRIEYINELQMEMTQLEAELRICQEEFEVSSENHSNNR